MVIVDSAGACWRIVRVTKLGHADEGFWSRLFRILLRQPVFELDQELAPEPPMSLAALQERVCQSMKGNPDRWRDNEAIAGEDGPPRDEQEMMDERTGRVRQASSFDEIRAVLWKL